MPVTVEDEIMTKNLFALEGYNADQLVRVFFSKGCNVGSIYELLQKLWVTGLVDYPGGSRQCNAHTADNIDLVYELVLHKNG